MASAPTISTYLKNLVALSRLSHQAHDPAARVRAREAVVASLRTDLLKTAQLGRLRALLKFSVIMSSLMEKGCRARLHFFRKWKSRSCTTCTLCTGAARTGRRSPCAACAA